MKIYQNPEHQKIYEEMSEHEHQRELFSWAAALALYGIESATLWASTHPQTLQRGKAYWTQTPGLGKADDRLDWLHAIPNGGSRGGNRAQRSREGGRMKSEGVKAGIPDIFLPRPLQGCSGLYIELKRVKGGRLDKRQEAFGIYAGQQGYGMMLCRGYWDAIEVLTKYLSQS